MDIFLGGLPLWTFIIACGIAFLAGLVKGTIGFALPLVMIVLLSSFMSPHMALAALILPVLATNLQQSLRFGVAPAVASARKFWRIIVATVIGMIISAPFVVVLPENTMFIVLGAVVLFFSVLQLSGWRPEIPPNWNNPIQFFAGLVGGLSGGISGVWGPANITYLLAARIEPRETVRVLSVIFLIGSVLLVVLHLRSGLLNAQTLPLSFAMLFPAALGMIFGSAVQDRLDAERFRRYALIMLGVIAINLLRRGFLG